MGCLYHFTVKIKHTICDLAKITWYKINKQKLSYNNNNNVSFYSKPVHVVTSIKQSGVLKGHPFSVLSIPGFQAGPYFPNFPYFLTAAQIFLIKASKS